MAVIVAGLGMLAFLGESTSSVFLMASLIVLGTGFGVFSSPNTNAVMSSVEKRYLGVASATIGTMRLAGQMISMAIATLVLHAMLGESRIVPANHLLFVRGIRIIFAVFALLCTLGVFASLARGERDRPIKPKSNIPESGLSSSQ
jgi:MFS family permease